MSAVPPSDFFTDPLADLDAFFNQTNAEINDIGVPAWSFDDLFNEDAFASSGDERTVEKQIAVQASPSRGSPAPSTESEQSLALDLDEDPFAINLPPIIGVMHSHADILPLYQVPPADPKGIDDVTMLQTFGATYGAFGDLAQFNGNTDALGLGPAYLDKMASVVPIQQNNIAVAPAFEAMLASTDWSASFSVIPTSVAPAALSLPCSTSLKRKDSSSSDESEQPAKRTRGRPKGRHTRPQAVITTPPASTPLFNTVALDEADDAKRSASGKPSTARPKSVVPEKYFKDGTAQAITGMTMEEILAFPTYDELLKQVSADKRSGAEAFGERIAENRDKAKDAAKKSREEKRQKIEQLEGQVDGLEDQVARMRLYLRSLLGSGRVSEVEIAAFL